MFHVNKRTNRNNGAAEMSFVRAVTGYRMTQRRCNENTTKMRVVHQYIN
jgi:hypothetical protein